MEFSKLWRTIPHSCGVFLQLGRDTGKIAAQLDAWPEKDIKAIVVTDGQRILGLGDLGANGMGIPVGKMALYTGIGGIHPSQCLPVTLDVGSNTADVLEQDGYIGLKAKRGDPGSAAHDEYLSFVDEFVTAVTTRYGKNTMIQWEDFGNHNAFALLDKYQKQCCCFNDDVQGTAAVALAGMFAATKLTGRDLKDEIILFNGAGEAGCGIAQLVADAIAAETGCTPEQSRKNIWLFDSRGLVYDGRASGGIAHHKAPFAHHAPFGPQCTTLVEAARAVRPTALIGVSAQPGTFTEELLSSIVDWCPTPLVFPLSNPTSKAECTAEQAYSWTGGRAVVATGSPFAPVTLASGEKRIPGQGNNVYVFPGVGLGVKLASKCGEEQILIDSEDMRSAAATCASLVTREQLDNGCIYPPLSQLRLVAASIAHTFVERRYPGQMSLEDCQSQMYTPSKL